MAQNQNDQSGKGNRGFAAMHEEKQREIASKGGRASHEQGTGNELTPEEAREAGRKGGEPRAQSNPSNKQGGIQGGPSQRGGSAEQQGRDGEQLRKNR